MPQLRIAQDPAADELLGRDPLALVLGMLLDQQFPMERAFASPRLLADRLGVDRLDAAALATADPERLTKIFQGPPALHRYPGSMAGRTQELCRLLVDRYDGRPEKLWADARQAFKEGDKDRGYRACGEIVGKYYAASSYRYAKQVLEERR